MSLLLRIRRQRPARLRKIVTKADSANFVSRQSACAFGRSARFAPARARTVGACGRRAQRRAVVQHGASGIGRVVTTSPHRECDPPAQKTVRKRQSLTALSWQASFGREPGARRLHAGAARACLHSTSGLVHGSPHASFVHVVRPIVGSASRSHAGRTQPEMTIRPHRSRSDVAQCLASQRASGQVVSGRIESSCTPLPNEDKTS